MQRQRLESAAGLGEVSPSGAIVGSSRADPHSGRRSSAVHRAVRDKRWRLFRLRPAGHRRVQGRIGHLTGGHESAGRADAPVDRPHFLPQVPGHLGPRLHADRVVIRATGESAYFSAPRAQRKPRRLSREAGSSPLRKVARSQSGWLLLQEPPRLTASEVTVRARFGLVAASRL
jgi:hypothetical protein